DVPMNVVCLACGAAASSESGAGGSLTCMQCGQALPGVTESQPLAGRTVAETLDHDARVGRKRLVQVFNYLEALNQHRNPARRQIEEQPWVLWLRDLPDHPAISRGAVTSDGGTSSIPAANGWLLSVRRPTTTLPPAPPAWLRDWLVGGWEEPNGS